MEINVFKFGGASVNSAGGVRNVAGILRGHLGIPLVVVVSAMGKTTNALEEVLECYFREDPVAVVEAFEKVRRYHATIMQELFPDPGHPVFGEVDSLFNQLRGYIRRGHLYLDRSPSYDFEYDQIVCYGELISSSILHHYLVSEGLRCTLFDVRELIRTDANYRDARVDWKTTENNIRESVGGYLTAGGPEGKISLTQGFIGSDPAGNTTTLGREGSDFSAAIFAWCLRAKEMTIWKDVPGVMNGDPRWITDAVCMETLSYREAVELAYYGASVIHPKTIKPLENANITLRVRSFQDPGLPGTTVKKIARWSIDTPFFIRKQNQLLISLSARDFSFILEENLSHIFRILADHKVKVNVMHNSAISFSFCVDADQQRTAALLEALRLDYETRYNEGLELITIRHYNEAAIQRMSKGRKVMMEMRSRNTVQLVIL